MLGERVQTVRGRIGEEFRPDCSRKTITFPRKVMVWGVISIHGTSISSIVAGTMNAVKYIEMLNSRLKSQVNKLFEDKPCIF